MWDSTSFLNMIAEKYPRMLASDVTTEGCLVIEGGALRSIYAIGVLDALMRNDLNFTSVIGVSAGALIGSAYMAGAIGQGIHFVLENRNNSRFVGKQAYRESNSIMGFAYMFEQAKDWGPEGMSRFMDPGRSFTCAATSLVTGEAVYFNRKDRKLMSAAIQASASMPYVSKPVVINHNKYLDGGCSVHVPYRRALSEGHKRIIVIRTRDVDFRAKENDSFAEKNAHAFYRKYPRFAHSLAQSNREYNEECDELAQLAETDRVFVLAPSEPLHISRLESDESKLAVVYDLGYADTLKRLPELRAYLNRH